MKFLSFAKQYSEYPPPLGAPLERFRNGQSRAFIKQQALIDIHNELFMYESGSNFSNDDKQYALRELEETTCGTCLFYLYEYPDLGVVLSKDIQDNSCLLCNTLSMIWKQVLAESAVHDCKGRIKVDGYSEKLRSWHFSLAPTATLNVGIWLGTTVASFDIWCDQLLYEKASSSISTEEADLSTGRNIREEELANVEQVRVDSPSLEARLRKAAAWLAECRKCHSECEIDEPFEGPPRLLDVRHFSDDGLDIALVDDHDQIRGEPYACLSHCWGQQGVSQLRLLRNNLARLKTCIPWTELAKTFQDAVDVCRHIGVRYLWIDSLCIIQDEEEGGDWLHHVRIMSSIYQHSLLTIEATRSGDSTKGFLQPTEILVSQGKYLATVTSSSTSRTDAPLLDRAWTFQEHLLSRRTLSFAIDGMHWDCRCESTIRDRRNYETLDMIQALAAVKTMSREQFGVFWRAVLRKYSCRNVTQPNDRLVALAGIIRYIAQERGERCFAGHWAGHILDNLAWRTRDPCPEFQRDFLSIAPSWSWASSGIARPNSRVAELDLGSTTPMRGDAVTDNAWLAVNECIQVLSVDCADIGFSDGRQQSGQLVIKTLTLFATVVPYKPEASIIPVIELGEGRVEAELTLDIDLKVEKQVLCAMLPVDMTSMSVCLLVLEESARFSGCWERIGLAEINRYLYRSRGRAQCVLEDFMGLVNEEVVRIV